MRYVLKSTCDVRRGHFFGARAVTMRVRTTRRIGFRHGSVVAARAYKRPELAAIVKSRFRERRSRATSQTPRAPDATGAHRRTNRGAAGRASPGSRGRWCVRTAAAKGRKPTICGLGAPGALRRTLPVAHADETCHIAMCWAGAHVPAESSGVICVHTLLAAGAMAELGAEISRMSEYGASQLIA